MSTEFKGLTAVVTGAGSGIGLSVARMLSESGAKVFGLDLSAGDMGTHATFIPCDVSDPSKVAAAFSEIAKATDVIDILANNAGVGAIGSITDAKEEEWSKVFGVNVFGMGRVSAAAMPFLKKSKVASIVNTCSIAATAGLPQRAVYSASKGAVLSLTLAMAADGIADKVRVNCVAPGTADTPWVSRLLSQAPDPAAERAALEARQPMGRLVSADEVASAILYLASPRQASTTGIVLSVDGGMQGLRLRK
ncbi:FabG Dehydrogenases with different specificities (related to short-chain alcohol dehydrogenases) [Candidatus Nanopelagicaceae bacterium]